MSDQPQAGGPQGHAAFSTPGANPFAPPSAEVADVAVATNEPAPLGARFFAAIIDMGIQLAVFFPAAYFLPFSLMDPDPPWTHTAVLILLGLVLFLLVQGALLVREGQTWGKRFRGLRIVRPDGSRASAGRVLGLRYGVGFLISSIPGLGPLWGLVDSLCIFRASRRCLHDNIADTIVVNA